MSANDRDRRLAIEQAQLRGFERSIAGVEWLLLSLVLLYVFVVTPDAARQLALLGVLIAFAASLLILRFAPGAVSEPARRLTFQIVLMVAFLTAVLGLLGDTGSRLLNLYLLPITAGALMFGRRGALLVTGLVCACYFGLVAFNAWPVTLSAATLTQAATVLMPFALVAFMTSQLAENIRASQRKIQALSDRDGLTGLFNIGAFMRRAERAHALTAKRDGTYSILLIDINQLKQINDTYGHDAGNRAIKTVAEALLRVTQAQDIVARFSGEEFIAFLANQEVTAATEIGQRLRSLAYASTFEVNVDIVRIQVSVGVANFPVDGDSLERVMSAADRAMYEDKALRATPEGQLVIQKR